MIFYRSDFTEIWIRIVSNETLGVLNSDYIQDYYGSDGYLTLKNKDTNERFPIAMSPVLVDTPSVSHDVFIGNFDLSSLPNGNYTVEGRVVDLAGNYTILGDFENPLGTEEVSQFNFKIANGDGFPINVGPISFVGGYSVSAEFPYKDLTGETLFFSDTITETDIHSDILLTSSTLESLTITTRFEEWNH